MIGGLRGTLLHKQPGQVLLDVQGVGYEVFTTVSLFDRLPAPGQELQLFIAESMGMYGGGLTLYGFISLEEKEIYNLLRDVPGTGAKKAMDYLDKISKSSPDFRRAILDNDAAALTGLFGFTKKTAEKMVVALKDRLAGLRIVGKEKWSTALPETAFGEAVAALVQLGYRESEARAAIDRLPSPLRDEKSPTVLVKEALKQLA
jgi:holliday junction DNA helicase RuvA